MSSSERGNGETTAVDLLVVVKIGQRVQHAATHVGDVGLGEFHVGTDDASQAAVPHEVHHDLIMMTRWEANPEIAFPVEAVVDPHYMLAVADLLENQLIADVDQIAHAGHFHGENFLGRLLNRFVSG